MSDNGLHDGDLSFDPAADPDLDPAAGDDAEDELEPYEEVLEEWEYLGWFDLLPTGLMTVTTAFEDLATPRIDFDAAIPDLLVELNLVLVDDDPLWPVMSSDMPEEERLENHEEAYAEYLTEVVEQRAYWSELVARQPQLGVSTVNELAELLIGWGLLNETDDGLELVVPVPDPLDLLPLTEDRIARIILDRMGPEMEDVEDVLHEFLYHGDADSMATTLGKLAEQAEVSVEVARLTVAMLVSQPDSGLSVDRFGVLDAEGVEGLKEHQKFTLKVDRAAPGFSGHEH